MKFYGEATYWHNHPDLPRLAQHAREQMELQRMAACENLKRRALAVARPISVDPHTVGSNPRRAGVGAPKPTPLIGRFDDVSVDFC